MTLREDYQLTVIVGSMVALAALVIKGYWVAGIQAAFICGFFISIYKVVFLKESFKDDYIALSTFGGLILMLTYASSWWMMYGTLAP